MKFKRGILIILSFILSFPLFPSLYPEKISSEALVSILNINYTAKSKTPFSKAAIRIYDKSSGFDEVIDFSSLNNFENPAFPLIFYFSNTKAKIISVPFLDFVEYETTTNKTEISEILLNLTNDETKYIFDFLKNLHESLPNYSYDFDLETNNSFTHISAILNDCKNFFSHRSESDSITSNRSFFNYSRILSFSWKTQENKTPLKVFSSQNHFYDSNLEKSFLKLPNVSFSQAIFLLSLSIITLFYTIYQTLVIFYRQFYHSQIFRIIQCLDFLFLFISGIAGLVILFQDCFSTQSIFRNNFQFLYLFPLNFVMAFNTYHQIFKTKFLKIYWLTVSSLAIIYVIIAWILSRDFPVCDMLTAIPLFIRYIYFEIKSLLFSSKP